MRLLWLKEYLDICNILGIEPTMESCARWGKNKKLSGFSLTPVGATK
ncbi:hypothetical protein CPD4_09 [Clostridium phage CPD4]|nr:hypothetical protein CPD4_09 [Clostridium phage CPD4]QGF20057.1 hypothetical protein CPAS15_0006 [Clostridium phage CPAS-15]